MLKWIAERVGGGGQAVKTAIGNLPAFDALDLSGLNVNSDDLRTLLTVDVEAWKAEAANR